MHSWKTTFSKDGNTMREQAYSPNEALEPGIPRKIAMATTEKWMHEMGFAVLTARKES